MGFFCKRLIWVFVEKARGSRHIREFRGRYTPNDAVVPYSARYQLYGEINRAMTPMWERIANPQILQ